MEMEMQFAKQEIADMSGLERVLDMGNLLSFWESDICRLYELWIQEPLALECLII